MMQSVYDLSSGHISLGDGHVQGILSSHTRLSTTRRNSSSQDLDDRASLAASYYGNKCVSFQVRQRANFGLD